jgi:hypothetical protein
VPGSIRKSIQYVDLFPDWDKGVSKVEAAVRRATRTANRLKSRLAS